MQAAHESMTRLLSRVETRLGSLLKVRMRNADLESTSMIAGVSCSQVARTSIVIMILYEPEHCTFD